MTIQEILRGNDRKLKKALFLFNEKHSEEEVLLKFNLWSRYFFPKYFTSQDADFHKDIDRLNLGAYLGEVRSFVNVAFRGAAKRQPLDANILTPSGYKKMGDLSVGDKVIGSDGKPVKIEYVSPIVSRPVYRVKTRDGRSTECDSEHLWTVRKMHNVTEKHVTVDTQYMIDRGLFYERFDKRYPGKEYKEYKFSLETVKPVQLDKRDLEIEPYLLGALLGNGNFNRKYGSSRITCHKDDESHYRREFKGSELGNPVIDKRNTNVHTFCIKGIGRKILGMKLNCHGNDKFIPEDYLYGDIDQRKAVLEGLMDTDGTVTNGVPTFCSASEDLADGVVSLARSLGGRASKFRRENNKSGYYSVSLLFTDYKPFRLERKKSKCKLAKKTFSPIVSIELVGEKKGRCIKVENEDGLYVTDDFILTHNTARTKLFLAFCISSDERHFRRYIKVLAADGDNSTQIVTDIYNMLAKTVELYPEVFVDTKEKREERMSSFTTATGVKVKADTVGTDQRGAIQEENRQDLIWYEDFENRTTLRSARKTKSIWENMEEARTGLAVNGSCIYTANYISEAGNVHVLITKKTTGKEVLIIPIKDENGSTWPDRYSLEDIEQMKQDDDDFWGERMAKPSAGKDVFFNREAVDRQKPKEVIRDSGGLKVYREFNPSHRTASGHDVAGGVGLDSSTSVFIDFEVIPAQVCAVYANNTIKPDIFGYEVKRQSDLFGGSMAAIEKNNHGHTTIAIAKQQGVFQYGTEGKATTILPNVIPKEYGWHTNALTKPKMLFAFAKAVEDGLIELNDPDLIAECRSYTRNDLIDDENDPRLTTRHFDLLIAACIAWQMKDHATAKIVQQRPNYIMPNKALR